ncbi:MAG: hypothetical protein K0S81_2446 [Rhodospirillales bacterium]|nr:hypothetical protein [Rhodospirillales bacterium]
MARFIAVLLLLLTAAPAKAEGIAASDQAAIAAVIRDQIAAFRVDDAKRAFGYASPAIQAKFGTPEEFLDMVRSGYGQVYRAREVTFRDIAVEQGVPVQAVEIRGADGTGVLALYFMERQPDGSWKINGVIIAELPERMA